MNNIDEKQIYEVLEYFLNMKNSYQITEDDIYPNMLIHDDIENKPWSLLLPIYMSFLLPKKQDGGKTQFDIQTIEQSEPIQLNKSLEHQNMNKYFESIENICHDIDIHKFLKQNYSKYRISYDYFGSLIYNEVIFIFRLVHTQLINKKINKNSKDMIDVIKYIKYIHDNKYKHKFIEKKYNNILKILFKIKRNIKKNIWENF